MGYRFQFITLAGFHALNLSMYELARGYRDHGMTAYAALQEREFACEAAGDYRATKHQRFVGTGYFDQVTQCVSRGEASTTALTGSTEEAQFEPAIAGNGHVQAESVERTAVCAAEAESGPARHERNTIWSTD